MHKIAAAHGRGIRRNITFGFVECFFVYSSEESRINALHITKMVSPCQKKVVFRIYVVYLAGHECIYIISE